MTVSRFQQRRRWWRWSLTKQHKKELVLGVRRMNQFNFGHMCFRYLDMLLEISDGLWNIPVWS